MVAEGLAANNIFLSFGGCEGGCLNPGTGTAGQAQRFDFIWAEGGVLEPPVFLQGPFASKVLASVGFPGCALLLFR